MNKKKKMELDYYFYSYGNRDATEFISEVLEWKDYKTFMRLYHSPENGFSYYLPDVGYVREEGCFDGDTRNITLKRYFDKITYFEYEHG